MSQSAVDANKRTLRFLVHKGWPALVRITPVTGIRSLQNWEVYFSYFRRWNRIISPSLCIFGRASSDVPKIFTWIAALRSESAMELYENVVYHRYSFYQPQLQQCSYLPSLKFLEAYNLLLLLIYYTPIPVQNRVMFEDLHSA